MKTPQDYGFIGVNHLSDSTPYSDFRDFLHKQGVAYSEREISFVGTFYAPVQELMYTQPLGDRYAYLVTSRPEIDAFYQDVYLFTHRVPDEELFGIIRALQGSSPPFDRERIAT